MPSTLLALAALWPLAQTPPQTAAPAQTPANDAQSAQRKQALLAAYRKTNTYQATNRYAVTEKRRRWLSSRSTEFHIAFDRTTGRLMVDMPEAYLVVDRDKIRLRSDQFRGRHLEVDAPRPLTYRGLVEALPLVGRFELADLKFLLGADPTQGDADIQVRAMPPNPNDERKRPLLVFQNPRYVMVVHMNPTSQLATLVHMEWNTRTMGRPSGDVSQIINDIEIKNHNAELPADVFAFEVIGSRAVKTLDELAGRHRLLGQPAPQAGLQRLDGEPFKLSAVDDRLVLLHFWAVWYPARQRELETLQRIRDWAVKTKKPLRVFAVDLKDDPGRVQAEVRKMKLDLAVLLGDESVATAFDATELPRSVLLADRRINLMLEALDVEEARLKAYIDRLVARPAEKRPAE